MSLPEINDADVQAVLAVVRSSRLALGPQAVEFERQVADYVGVKHALARKVTARGYFAPIHTQPYIREHFGDLSGTLPVTEAIAPRTLALPFHNNLSEVDVDPVVTRLAQVGRTSGLK